METMTASFSARPSVRLDNMIVYSGPPAGKNQKIQPPRQAPTSQARDDSLPAGAIRTGRAGVVENGSGSSTSNVDNYKDLTSTIATLTSHEAANYNGPFDTSIPTETNAYHSIADIAFGTAIQPDMWDHVANSACTRTADGSARNESTYTPSFSMTDVQYVCSSAMSSATALADPQQRTQDDIECTSLGSSSGPEVRSRSPSPAVMRANACSANNAPPVRGSIGRGCPGGLVRTDHDDAPVAVHPAICNFPEETPPVCVALEAQPHQSSTPIGRDFHDEHWAQDQDAVTGEHATLVLAGDPSCPASDQENSLHHENIRAGSGVTVAEEPDTAREENGTCDSSDDDVVPWIPKRRRALLVSSGPAGRRDSSQPSMRRKRRQTHTAELASRPIRCRTTAPQMSSPPPNRRVAKARSGSRKNITSISTSTQDEGPVLTRDLGFASEPSWEVDRIVGSTRRHGKVFYRVQWEPTWEPAESLQGSADAAVAEFRSSNKRRRIY